MLSSSSPAQDALAVFSLRGRIVHFSSGLSRCPSHHSYLREELRSMLSHLSQCILHSSLHHECLHHLSILFRLMGYTRDIVAGKGECDLTYLQLCEWFPFFPTLACSALRSLVLPFSSGQLPFGSWKDIKRFCLYAHTHYSWNIDHPMIVFACQLLNHQLQLDTVSTRPSLVAKWIPREKSRAGSLLFSSLAAMYFPFILHGAHTPAQQQQALLKCKTLYRQLISQLNRQIRTVEVLQCARQWKDIHFPRDVTAHHLLHQSSSFLATSGGGDDDDDRTHCRNHFLAFLQSQKGQPSPSVSLSLADFERTADRLLSSPSSEDRSTQMHLLNNQWNQFVNSMDSMHPNWRPRLLVPLLDSSVDLCFPATTGARIPSLALAIYLASSSSFGKRILLLHESHSSWIDLSFAFLPEISSFPEQCGFVGAYHHIRQRLLPCHRPSFSAAAHLLHTTCRNASLSKEDIQSMVLVILSSESSFEHAKQIIRSTFLASFGCPQIWLWNLLSSSSTAPSTSSMETNITYLSGHHPAIVAHHLGAHPSSAHQTIGIRNTPWSILQQQLNHPRFRAPLLSDFGPFFALFPESVSLLSDPRFLVH